ncbi:MAG: hypothetical protein HYR56_05480, partial [Acidobacteria bacterium]|nr:hypothetical protein [Acidobacteriota bacterium]
MQKRTFLKISSAGLTGSLLAPLTGCQQPGAPPAAQPSSTPAAEKLKNWAGNLEYSTANVAYPE